MRGLVLRIVGEDGALLMGLYLDIQLDKKSTLQVENELPGADGYL